MTFKQLIQLLPKVVRYNLKIIFAGKFFWFLLAAFGFFALFMFQNAWKREEINEGLIYSILMFPSMLLIFYPAVFGIQNDEDSRILEILFGIPDYNGRRLLQNPGLQPEIRLLGHRPGRIHRYRIRPPPR